MPYKRKYKRGEHIESLDELVKQEFVYFVDKITPKGWFLSWQLNFTIRWLGPNGRIYYAEKVEEENDDKAKIENNL